ncbi:MAG: DUF3106 domain-containing protein [Rhodocyclaceae bacterium]
MAAARAGVLILLLLASAAAFAVTPLGNTRWEDLSASQQQVLAPLAGDWETMGEAARQTWIGIADGFDGLTAEEKGRVRSRMRDWASLSSEERARARDQYRALRNMPPEQREQLGEQWRQYRERASEHGADTAE